MFNGKWVDKCICKRRFTCADVKARHSPEQEQDMNVFVPTPTPDAHSLLEVARVAACELETVAAFLFGTRGAQQGKPVYIGAPPEWWDIFVEWSDQLSKAERELCKMRDIWFRLDGNLYGRWAAGSVYRDELKEVLGKLRPHFEFNACITTTARMSPCFTTMTFSA